jgi:histidinol-phosphate aminotransferase
MLAKQYISDLQAYQPGLPIELVAREYGLQPKDIVKLASNENPLGPSPKAVQAVRLALLEVHRYPEQHALTHALAAKYGVHPEQVVIGNGSNDLIDLIARVYLGVHDEAISSEYGFAMYRIAVQTVGATNVIVPAKDYGHDLQAMAAAITPRTKVIWLANPNNPTGTFISYAEIKQWLSQVPSRVLVVVDEAYIEYLDDNDVQDATMWLPDHPNVILLRTFSKIYGLAGLRVGYGLMAPEVAELLNRVRLPFNVTSVAITAAVAALADKAYVLRSYRTNKDGRAQLVSGLQALKLTQLPAYGNFVTFEVPDAARVYEQLLRQGVIVRPLAGYGLVNWLRVSVGTTAENQRFLDGMLNLKR